MFMLMLVFNKIGECGLSFLTISIITVYSLPFLFSIQTVRSFCVIISKSFKETKIQVLPFKNWTNVKGYI